MRTLPEGELHGEKLDKERRERGMSLHLFPTLIPSIYPRNGAVLEGFRLSLMAGVGGGGSLGESGGGGGALTSVPGYQVLCVYLPFVMDFFFFFFNPPADGEK